MLVSDGYSLTYYKDRNKIAITLPQTVYTLTNTIEPVVDRIVDVDDIALANVLFMVKQIFQKGEE